MTFYYKSITTFVSAVDIIQDMLIVFFNILRIYILLLIRYFGFIFAKNKQDWLDIAVLDFAQKVLSYNKIKIEIIGEEYLKKLKNKSIVIMSNHLSWFDTPIFLATMPFRPAFIVKKELLKIPILGFFIKAIGCEPLNRKSKVQGYRAIVHAAQTAKNHNWIIFPEGTRSKTKMVNKFRLGSIHLPLMAKSDILPVTIIDSDDVLLNLMAKKSSQVKIIISEPIAYSAYSQSEKSAVLHNIHQIIKNNYIKYQNKSDYIPQETESIPIMP